MATLNPYMFEIRSPHIDPHDAVLLPNLIEETFDFARNYMGQYDASHDYQHLRRVISLTLHLAKSSPFPKSLVDSTQTDWDENILILAALLHDVGDKKYSDGKGVNSVFEYLESKNCSVGLCTALQDLVSSVSYTFETCNPPSLTQEKLKRYPELACVQDADRLDAIGAIGIGRTFTFGGAKKRSGEGMRGTIQHFDEKLLRLGSMMKTEMGKEMGKERTRRMTEFMRWWDEEAEVMNLSLPGL